MNHLRAIVYVCRCLAVGLPLALLITITAMILFLREFSDPRKL
jgi:hypothetical protein